MAAPDSKNIPILVSSGTSPIQAFPLIQGQVNLTSGTYTDIHLIYCVADGNITITWPDGTTSTIICAANDVFTVGSNQQVEVVAASGTFHLA